MNGTCVFANNQQFWRNSSAHSVYGGMLERRPFISRALYPELLPTCNHAQSSLLSVSHHAPVILTFLLCYLLLLPTQLWPNIQTSYCFSFPTLSRLARFTKCVLLSGIPFQNDWLMIPKASLKSCLFDHHPAALLPLSPPFPFNKALCFDACVAV